MLPVLAGTSSPTRVKSPFNGPFVEDTGEYNVQLVRYDGGTGSCLVEGGFPLKPGQLQPSEADQVSLWIGGVEQTVYTEMLEGTHADGSAMACFIQTTQTVNDGTPVNAVVKIGTTQTQTQAKSTSYKRLAYTSGGTTAIAVNDVIEGDTSGATATVKYMVDGRYGGIDWALGSMTGHLYLQSQTGTFQSETISVQGGQSNIATIAGDSTDCVLLKGRAAIIACTDVEHLIRWDVLGPLIAESSYPTGVATTFETNWETNWSNMYASSYGSYSFVDHANFYDLAWSTYQKWAISGDSDWFVRAVELNEWWYDEAMDGMWLSVLHHQSEGYMVGYLMTGGREILDGIINLANYYPGELEPAADYTGTYSLTEGRAFATLGRTSICAHILGESGWDTEVNTWIDNWLAYQHADGSWEDAYDHLSASAPEKNYMNGMACDMMIRAYELCQDFLTVGREGNIEQSIQDWVDFQQDDPTNPQWDATYKSFWYEVDDHTGSPTLAQTPPLNGLNINQYGFAYELTGLTKYKTNVEEQLEGMNDASGDWDYFKKNLNQVAYGARNAIARIYG